MLPAALERVTEHKKDQAMTADKKPKAKPWQYSLRALFVVTTVVALWAALWQRDTELAINLAIAAGFLLLPELPLWVVRRRFN